VARRLILDTNALIAFERGALPDPNGFDDDDLAIAAITVAEFRTGIELADTPQRATTRARTLAAILDAITVLDYTQRTAAEHARLLAHARRTGAPRSAHDLLIAAHAVEHGRAIVSLDTQARFGYLPGVQTVDD
jgi:tRNA(fMet)-specific endonuclease VapC